ncbi:BadF/BadG/BcrA/BcrD ATPase family protein [Planomonospora alba]|uniref:BadF/BadG/BcrA/BcrD ATPase family protein n=1 Tax=Planomonospora alba TaxID=161354 RepID=A0ABP6N608_9ACTN
MTALVVGVDGGGTSTRCVVATHAGEVAGRGRAAGSNALSSADPGAALRAALRAALGGLPPGQVTAGVFALAGSGPAGGRAAGLAADAWRACGLAGRPAVVPDTLAAFAGATAEPSGTVLVAGTGAVATRVTGRGPAGRADGYGWILGDEGSGAWIGRRAVRAVLAALDGRAGPTALRDAVPGGGAAERIVDAVHAGVAEAGPAWLARLAPAVEAAARHGDAAALAIVREAAERLLATVRALGPCPGPLVLAGSLLTEPTLLAERVRAGLAGAGLTVLTARSGDAGARGAAALALHGPGPGTPASAAAHRRLLS